MGSANRRETIKSLLAAKPFVSLNELEEIFPQVSPMTLRRDIEFFERCGEAIKVRGGARSMKFITTSMEDAFSLRLTENRTAKQVIAAAAVGMIETGRSVFLDSGTTMLTLASILPDERFTVTTTAPNVAIEIAKKHNPIVNIVGGMLNRDNISIAGNQALRHLTDINIDIAFIVPSGFTLDGLTSGNYAECELKQAVISKARRVVALTDSTKYNRLLPYTVCGFDKIDTVITDRPLVPELKEALEKAGTSVVIAQ